MDERMMSEIAATWAVLDTVCNQLRERLEAALELAVDGFTQSRDHRFLDLAKEISAARAKLETLDALTLPF